MVLMQWNPLPAHFTTLEIMILGGLEPIPAYQSSYPTPIVLVSGKELPTTLYSFY